MSVVFFKRLGWFVLLVLIQAMVFNRIHLFGCATPFLYIYFLLALKADVSRNALLLWGFTMGLAVDVFSNTLGMNAMASTILAFFRPTLLGLFAPREGADELVPGIHGMGIWPFSRYVLAGAFLHHSFLLFLESFSFFDCGYLLVAVLSCTLLSACCIVALDGLCRR